VSDDVAAKNEELQRAYALAFGSPAGQAVLADLAPFCRAATTTFHPDARVHAALEGRREVWLRITQFMNLRDEEILQLALQRAQIKPKDEKDG
jgi:hypothetical protein